jgi:hypothetical protein
MARAPSLKVHLGARRVRFCGISDEVLEELHDEAVEPERLTTWEHTELERAHLQIVEKWLAPATLLGPRVAAVLASGRTIGIANLSFRARLIPALFGAVLRLAWGRRSRTSRLEATLRVRGRSYRAILTADRKAGGYTVQVPKLPGCISEGDTMAEPKKMAREAIGLWLDAKC